MSAAGLRVRFWGVRGSVPTPGPETVRYGGNTACVSVERAGGDLLILDAGTGIRLLGLSLIRAARVPITAHLLLSHSHWDHIQGFPFFVPAFAPGSRLVVHGGTGTDEDLAATIEGQMVHRYFPVALAELGAQIEFRHVEPGWYEFGGARIGVARLRHTGPTVGYRVECNGCVVAYATDTEPPDGSPDGPPDPAVIELARGADLLIHDAQYTDEEYSHKVGWGHSPVGYALAVARAAGPRCLALFHHDPMRGDDQLDGLLAAARTHAAQAGAPCRVIAAAEGLELTLG